MVRAGVCFNTKALSACALALFITGLLLIIVGVLRFSVAGSSKPAGEESCTQEVALRQKNGRRSSRSREDSASREAGEKAAEKQKGKGRRRRGRGLHAEQMGGGRYRGCGRNASVCEELKGECCNGRCVEVGKERSNCGGCGFVCPFMLSCCQGCCVDLASDPFNCGQCGHCCQGLTCQFGLCDYY